MAVVLVHQGQGLTRESYDETVQRLIGGRPESTSDWPVEGLLSHAAGQGPDGFRVVDLWESEEACRRFGEHLQPILGDAANATAGESFARFVTTCPNSVNHNACSDPLTRYIEPLTPTSPAAPVHPNARGEAYMADVVRRTIRK